MAVGAERDEVRERVQLVAAAQLGHRDEVVDRDEVQADLAVSLLEGEPAGRAAAAVERNAGPPRVGVLFVAVHHDPGDRVLRVGAGTGPGGVRAGQRPEVPPQGPDRRFLGRLNAQLGGIIMSQGTPGSASVRTSTAICSPGGRRASKATCTYTGARVRRGPV